MLVVICLHACMREDKHEGAPHELGEVALQGIRGGREDVPEVPHVVMWPYERVREGRVEAGGADVATGGASTSDALLHKGWRHCTPGSRCTAGTAPPRELPPPHARPS